MRTGLVCIVLMLSACTAVTQRPLGNQGLNVSFHSECCGVNREAAERLDVLLAHFEKGQQLSVRKVTRGWGKEGEYDHCLSAQNLSGQQRDTLFFEVRKAMQGQRLVLLEEVVSCETTVR